MLNYIYQQFCYLKSVSSVKLLLEFSIVSLCCVCSRLAKICRNKRLLLSVQAANTRSVLHDINSQINELFRN